MHDAGLMKVCSDGCSDCGKDYMKPVQLHDDNYESGEGGFATKKKWKNGKEINEC